MRPPGADALEIGVDLCNPGEFLACCGLLEIADRLWPGSEGWFGDSTFFLRTDGTLREILDALLERVPTEVTLLPSGLRVRPLIAPLQLPLSGVPSGCLWLDAWMTVGRDRRVVAAVPNPPWNFWSGQQTPLRIWLALREAFRAHLARHDVPATGELFSHRVLLSGRFGFDPGAAWTALDVGFSPNEQRIDVASSPAVELLGAIGLQRFRPSVEDGREAFKYAAWHHPMQAIVAGTAAGGALPVASSRFSGRVISRGSYAALSYAHMETRP